MRGRLSALRYRPWQALVLLCLSAVVAGTTVLAPLYDRALQQAMASTLVDEATPDLTSVSVRSTGLVSDSQVGAPYDTDLMVQRFPEVARPYFQEPITTLATSVAYVVPDRPLPRALTADNPVGALLHRDGMCDHVELTAGACPAAVGEIAISSGDAETFGWELGDRVGAMESSALVDHEIAHVETLTVVGIYTTDPEQAYWVGRAPVGRAGLLGGDGSTQHDGWLTAPDTLAGSPVLPERGRWESWVVPERTVDLLLDRDAVGIDELFEIAAPLDSYLGRPVDQAYRSSGASATGYSGLPSLAERAETGRDNAHQLVPLFVIQLALLAALTLWLVLGAAVEQRRPEVAVVRLRGGDARSCRRLLVAELGPPILVGWLVGLALAALALLVVGRQWLDPDLELEVRPVVIATAVGVLVVEWLLLLAATWSAVRATATDLLRRVRPRTGWALSIGPVVVVLLCGAAFAATAAGSLTGSAATAAPTLLAVAVGLVIGFLLGPVAGRAGSALLGRGRLVAGLGLLQLGRRHGMRTAIATIVAAAALLAFAVNALGVGERNRTELAKATVGAPTVLLTGGGTELARVRAAVRELDPSGESATLTATVSSPGGMSTMAVVPDEYARVAAFTDAAAAAEVADALRDTAAEPLELSGRRLTLETAWTTEGRLAPVLEGGLPIGLDAVVVRPERAALMIPLEPSGGVGATEWTTTALPCQDGCWLTAIAVSNRTDGDLQGRLAVTAATLEGTALELGDRDDWTDGTTHDNGFARPRAADTGIAFNVLAHRGFDARLGHGSVPERVPAVTSGQLPPDAVEGDFTSVGLDAVNRDMHQVASAPYLPGAPANAAVVDLDVIERDGVTVDLATRLRVYLDESLPVDDATAVLHDHGISVDTVTTLAGTEDDYRHSAPAWGLQLGVVAAAVAALLAGLVLMISFITSWRLRAADSVALRLNGLSRRKAMVVAVLETVPLVLLSVAAGLACGVAGSRIALTDLPFFDVPPAVPVEDLSTSWSAVVVTGGALLAALALLATVTSLRLGRRSLSDASEET